jgi:diguanylate cyclase (GGDEF)-like protein
VPETGPPRRLRRPTLPIIACILAIGLLTVAVGAAVSEHNREREKLDRQLKSEAGEHAEHLEQYFSRARALTLITAQNPAFREFYEQSGARRAKVVAGGRTVRESNKALAYLEDLFPNSIGEACFIDGAGPENARAVKGHVAPLADLSADETAASFFKPSFALRQGEVFQGKPYISPDTHEWVIPNATPLLTRNGSRPAIIHFETTLESFRREAGADSGGYNIAIVDAARGRVLIDSRYRQPAGDKAKLGRPFDDRFARFAAAGGKAFDTPVMDVGGRRSALQRIDREKNNDNDWVLVASSTKPVPSLVDAFNLPQIAMAALGLLLLGFAVLTFRSSQAELTSAALNDPLTGLGNRRRLMMDLEGRLAAATEERPLLLALFDLDGFKGYNDSFGHPAGDALLQRLAATLGSATNAGGSAYRMGGDEFCVLARTEDDRGERVLAAASGALTEHGEGFTITASYGSILVPIETADSAEALRAADQRMYAQKNSGRASAGSQTTDVLVRVLAERYPDIGEHLDDVTALCERLARRLELPQDEIATVLRAASLHDIGKAAIPDAILNKRGPLTDAEWVFMRQHTVIGERILAAAPALSPAAKLVRWSHERMDGTGYPDGLPGDEIPLGARIIAVCDAYDAMTSKRPYRDRPMSRDEAVDELRREAGTHFDPVVVDAFCSVLAEQPVMVS